MSYAVRTGRYWLITLLPAVVLLCSLVVAQTVESESDLFADEPGRVNTTIIIPDTADFDLLYTKIVLDERGVIAIDTAGYEWRYDFESNVFVELLDYPEGPGRTEPRTGSDETPVEQRATVERKIRGIEGTVLIGADEYVDGDVVAYNRVTVRGWVKGDVTSYNNRVLVTASGRVDGDVTAPEIVVRDGGEVLGRMNETDEPIGIDQIRQTVSVDAIVAMVVVAILLIFFGFLAAVVMPQQLESIADCQSEHKVKCYLVGLLFLLLLPVVIVLLTITILGLILVPFVPLVYLAAITLGCITFSSLLGGYVLRKLFKSRIGIFVHILTGVFLLDSLWIITILLFGSGTGVLYGFGIAFLVLSICVTSFPVCTGVGAALLTRFGFHPYRPLADRRVTREEPPAPAPPPLQQPPPIVTPGPVPPPPAPPDPSDLRRPQSDEDNRQQ